MLLAATQVLIYTEKLEKKAKKYAYMNKRINMKRL